MIEYFFSLIQMSKKISSVLFFTLNLFVAKENTVLLNMKLNGSFTKKAVKLVKNGVELKIKYNYSVLLGKKNNKKLIEGKIIKTFRYNLLTRKFIVKNLNTNEIKLYSNFKKARNRFSSFKAKMKLKNEDKNTNYSLYVAAKIYYSSKLKNVKINPQVIWSYYTPVFKKRGSLINIRRK